LLFILSFSSGVALLNKINNNQIKVNKQITFVKGNVFDVRQTNLPEEKYPQSGTSPRNCCIICGYFSSGKLVCLTSNTFPLTKVGRKISTNNATITW
jgi:hypothetical protein